MRPVVVDGSNVGKVAGGGDGGPVRIDLAVLREAREALRRQFPGVPIVTVVDRYDAIRGDVPAELRSAVASAIGTGELIAPPVNVTGGDDRFILSMGEQHGAVVVSNDRFREHVSEFPWLADGDRLLGADRSPLGWTFTPRRISPNTRKRARATPSAAETAASSARPNGQSMQGAPAPPAPPRPSKTSGAKPAAAKPGAAKPAGANARGANAGGVQPGGGKSAGAKTGGPTPGGAKSGGARSGGAKSGGAKPGGAKSGSAKSGGAKPGGAMSGGTKADAKPGGAPSGAARSGVATSGGARPGPRKPGAARSGAAKPSGAAARGSARAKAASDRPSRLADPRPAQTAATLAPAPQRPALQRPALQRPAPQRPPEDGFPTARGPSASRGGPSGAVYAAAALVVVVIGLFVLLRDDPRKERARAALASAMFAQTRGGEDVELTEAEIERVLESMEDIDFSKGDPDEGRSDRACGRTKAWHLTQRVPFHVCVLVGPDSGRLVGSFDLTASEPLAGSTCIGAGVSDEVDCSGE